MVNFRSATTEVGNVPMREIDLIIIGSGPAGVSTALHLIQQHQDWAEHLLILEKFEHPRPKLCGGGVTRLGLQTLSDLGFAYPLPIPGAEVDIVHLRYGEHSIHIVDKPVLVIYDRSRFDEALVKEARRRGLQIRENEAVKNLKISSDGVLVMTQNEMYKAQVVVGADGSKGITRRFVSPNGRRIKVARLLEVRIPVDVALPHFAGRYARFDFTPAQKDLQGYYWEFPSWVEGKPVLNCGIYDARFVSKRARADLPLLLKSTLAERGFESDSIAVEGHPIHWFSPRARIAVPHLLLVGDAAGAEPLFGEGIAPALAYGKIAAEAIAAAFASGDFSFRDYKHRVLTSHLGRYLLLRWCVSWWAYHFSRSRRFMQTLWRAGNRLTFLY